MMGETIIFPSQPLFMVDRGWQRHCKKGSKNGRSQKMQGTRVPEISITVLHNRQAAEGSSIEAANHHKPASEKSKGPAQPQFVNHEATKRDKTHLPEHPAPAPRKGRRLVGKQRPLQESSLSSRRMPPRAGLSSQALNKVVTGTTSALYPVIDPEVSHFQDLLNYCESTQHENARSRSGC
jgi:hypothetical protein